MAGLLAVAGCAQTEVSNPSPQVSAPSPSTKATQTATTRKPVPSTSTKKATSKPSSPRSSSTPTRTTPKPAKPVTQPPLGTKVDCSKVACAALTFDDGPGRRSGELLRMLVKANAPATFFMLSSTAANNKQTAAAIAANPAMEIANHSISHPDLRNLSASGVSRQVVDAKQRLETQTGRTIDLFRPPYGSSNSTVRAAAASSGQAIIMWDVDTMDWSHRNSAKVVSIALRQVRAGSIILMHDIHSSTVDAVPNLIKALNQRGYTLVTVGTLLGTTKGGQTYSRR